MSRGQLGKHGAETESQASRAPGARAAGTSRSHFLGNLTQPDTPSSPPTDTSSFPAPQLSKLSCHGFNIISVFLLSLCLITILTGEETDDVTT